jgi:hypothetical protein
MRKLLFGALRVQIFIAKDQRSIVFNRTPISNPECAGVANVQ